MPKIKDRVPTGIPGLDKLIEGGFPRGSMVLVGGDVGSGKTTLAVQYLYNGIKDYGENGLYISLREDRKTIYRVFSRFGWDLEKLERERKLGIICISAEDRMDRYLPVVMRRIEEMGVKRLVLDSMSAMIGKREVIDPRVFLFSLYSNLRDKECTSILIAEKAWGSTSLGMGFEEFVADGLILMEQVIHGVEMRKRMIIVKMRGTSVNSRYHDVSITKSGIMVSPIAVLR